MGEIWKDEHKVIELNVRYVQITRYIVIIVHILSCGLEELLAIAIAAKEGAAANAATARGLRSRTESTAIVCPEEP